MLTRAPTGETALSDDVVAKVVVTVIVMIAFMFGMAMERAHTAHCQRDCPTDISAIRR
jgi:hypothetical protein